MVTLGVFERELTKKERRALREWSRSYRGVPAVIDDASERFDELAEVVLRHLRLENMKSRLGRGPVKLYLFKLDGEPHGTIYSLWSSRERLEGYSRPSWRDAVRAMRSIVARKGGVLVKSADGSRYLGVIWDD